MKKRVYVIKFLRYICIILSLLTFEEFEEKAGMSVSEIGYLMSDAQLNFIANLQTTS